MSTFTVRLNERTSEALRLAAAQRHRTEEEVISDFLESIFEVIQNHVIVLREESELSAADNLALEEGVAQLRRGEGVPHAMVVAEMRARFAR